MCFSMLVRVVSYKQENINDRNKHSEAYGLWGKEGRLKTNAMQGMEAIAIALRNAENSLFLPIMPEKVTL